MSLVFGKRYAVGIDGGEGAWTAFFWRKKPALDFAFAEADLVRGTAVVARKRRGGVMEVVATFTSPPSRRKGAAT